MKTFKDKSTNLFGIRNIKTKQIIVNAKYNSIVDFNDTLIIIKDNDLFSVVDYNDNEIIAPVKYKLFFDFENPNYYGKIRALDYSTFLFNYFLVNSKGECIPQNYEPCTCLKDMVKSNVPEDLIMIQKAVDTLTANPKQAMTTLEYVEKAIELNPENPANYFWYSNFVINYFWSPSIIRTEDIKTKYLPKLKDYINKSIDLEDDTFYLIYNYSFKYQLEKRIIRVCI